MLTKIIFELHKMDLYLLSKISKKCTPTYIKNVWKNREPIPKEIDNFLKTEYFKNMTEESIKTYLDIVFKKTPCGHCLAHYNFSLVSCLMGHKNISDDISDYMLSHILPDIYRYESSGEQIKIIIDILNKNNNISDKNIETLILYAIGDNKFEKKIPKGKISFCAKLLSLLKSKSPNCATKFFEEYDIKNNNYLESIVNLHQFKKIKRVINTIDFFNKGGVLDESLLLKLINIIDFKLRKYEAYRFIDILNLINKLEELNMAKENVMRILLTKLLNQILDYLEGKDDNMGVYADVSEYDKFMNKIIKYVKGYDNDILELFIINHNSYDEHNDINKKKRCNEIYDILFKEYGYVMTDKYMIRVLNEGDELLFTYLLEHNMLTLKNAMDHAMASHNLSFYIIEQLLMSKHELNMEHLKNLEELDDKLMSILKFAGISFDLNLVTFCFENDILIECDIKKYIDLDDKYLYVLYKYGKNIRKQDLNNNTNKMWQMIRKFATYNKEGIQKYIEDNNIVPNQYCYDMSFKEMNYDVIEWLESEYEFKPTMLTLLHIENLEDRFKIYHTYITKNKYISENYDHLYTLDNLIN